MPSGMCRPLPQMDQGEKSVYPMDGNGVQMANIDAEHSRGLFGMLAMIRQ